MTIKQKQHLLAYLGYYSGKVDGIWDEKSRDATIMFQDDFYSLSVDGIAGPETEKALKHAVAYGMPKDKVVVSENENTTKTLWEEIEHFTREEFKCKCGKCGGFPVEPSKELVSILEKIRKYFGKPVIVNSGIRCATHNKNVGGASMSQHLKGTAADILVKGIEPERVAKYAETLLPKSGGIGRYKTFTHIDVRSVKSRWNG